MIASLTGNIVATVIACTTRHLKMTPHRVVERFAPGETIGAVGRSKDVLVFARLKNHLETPCGIELLRLVKDDAGLHMVRPLVEIDQVVIAVAAILHQPQVRTFPVITIFTFGKTDPFKPTTFLAVLPQIPHVKFITDLMHRPIIDNMAVIGRTLLAQAEHNLGAATGRIMAHQFQLHAILEGDTMVVKGEKHKFS